MTSLTTRHATVLPPPRVRDGAAEAASTAAAGSRRAPSGPLRRAAVTVALCLVLSLGPGVGGAPRARAAGAGTPAGYGEYLIKAAFLYNFAKFTQWPGATDTYGGAPLEVCVLGQDPFGAALDSIAGKRIKDRIVTTRRVARLDQARGCQVLFISASETPRLGAILARLGTEPILTVTDEPAGRGASNGIISFQTIAGKVRFKIDTDHAAAAGLIFSSKLLSLAETYARHFGPQVSRGGPDG
ncbi:MAG: YfiR family protein [Kiloniellales bacterium]